jgi:aldehyde dehydrogenase (NAD+)
MHINPPWSVNNISTNRLLSVLAHTTSGGVTINDIMVHAGTPNTPFGGIGTSGHGSYHGRYGFDTFTHLRTVVSIPSWCEYLVGFRYPPWDK